VHVTNKVQSFKKIAGFLSTGRSILQVRCFSSYLVKECVLLCFLSLTEVTCLQRAALQLAKETEDPAELPAENSNVSTTTGDSVATTAMDSK
jgi:hypothetical protein